MCIYMCTCLYIQWWCTLSDHIQDAYWQLQLCYIRCAILCMSDTNSITIARSTYLYILLNCAQRKIYALPLGEVVVEGCSYLCILLNCVHKEIYTSSLNLVGFRGLVNIYFHLQNYAYRHTYTSLLGNDG